jgi:hypothetical protein
MIGRGFLPIPGSADLGTGSNLSAQVENETDEQRRRRIMQQQLQRLVPGASNPDTGGGYGIATPLGI